MPAPMITPPLYFPCTTPEEPALRRKPRRRIRGLLRMARSFPIDGTTNTGWHGSQEAYQHVSTLRLSPPLISTLRPSGFACQHFSTAAALPVGLSARVRTRQADQPSGKAGRRAGLLISAG